MSHDGWHHGPLVAFDLETTGVDVENDRIVSACVVTIQPGHSPSMAHWLLDPGMPIPDAAIQVHGIATETARGQGVSAPDGVESITSRLVEQLAADIPLVIYNAAYDLTLLDRECRRHHIPALHDRLGEPAVIDPWVLDKHLDPYRRGKRTLTAVCQHHNVDVAAPAHEARSDALVAARLAWRIADQHPHIAAMDLRALHDLQVTARQFQAASLADYLHQNGKPADAAATIHPEWPVIPTAA